MLNQADVPTTPLANPIAYADAAVAHGMANGQMNTEHTRVLENIRRSIRRGYAQMRPEPMRGDRICLVGSGPSLNSTERELRDLVWDGAALVTMNGAYHWCIERNLRPQTQIVMDARPSNARFLNPDVPKCNYVLASQCDPSVWDAVEGRPHVRIFHAVVGSEDAPAAVLNEYYQGQWVGVGGGVTVASRAISLLRMAGYVRFDLFGVDCCWDSSGEQNHALAQPENAHEVPTLVTAMEGTSHARQFYVSPWMLKQLEDILTITAHNGQHFQLEVHGDGMLAHVLKSKAAE